MYRPFCRYVALGAIYGLMNPISLVRMRVSKSRCGVRRLPRRPADWIYPYTLALTLPTAYAAANYVTLRPYNALKLDVH